MRRELVEQLAKITPEETEILKGNTGIDRSIYTEDRAFVIDRKKILDEGALIKIRTHTRFIPFPEHSHNYVEMVYMCKGVTHHMVDGTPIELKEGDILIMNQFARQEIAAAGEDDIALNFIILPEFFDETLRRIGHQDSALKEFLISGLQSQSASMTYLHFKVADVVPIQNLMENLTYSLLYEKNDSKADELTMALLFMQLLKHTAKMKTDRKSYERKLVLDALAYMEIHYRDGSLSDFAADNYCELSMLSRLIKKYTGFTWQELLQQKRMARACELLETSELAVADIAVAVGYENISFFHRLFKRFYDQSPKQYRKSQKEWG